MSYVNLGEFLYCYYSGILKKFSTIHNKFAILVIVMVCVRMLPSSLMQSWIQLSLVFVIGLWSGAGIGGVGAAPTPAWS